MKTTALIERANDGLFGIFTPDIDHTIIGSGATVAEAKIDFEYSVKEMLESYEGEELPKELKGITFEYKYDTASVFDELECINVTKFAKVAGIYPSTMRQYARGLAYISEKQAHKIEEALHLLGQRMQAVRL